MALSFLDNVDYRGKKPNFTRDLFDTIADMVAFDENYLPDVFIASNKETGKQYVYNRNNTIDSDLGKWRVLGGEGGGDNTVASVNGFTGEVELTASDVGAPTVEEFNASNSKVLAMDEEVAALKNSVKDNEDEIADVLALAEANGEAITGVATQAAQAVTTASEAIAKAEEAETTVSAQQSTVTNLANQISDLQTATDRHNADISELTGIVSNKANSNDVYSKTQVDSIVSGSISSVYKYKGNVSTVADLANVSDPETGHVYFVTEDSLNYAYNNGAWNPLAGIIDLSGYTTDEEFESALSNKADKTSIPTKVSDLENDEEHVTRTEVEAMLSSAGVGAVQTVNGKFGNVELTAEDVGAISSEELNAELQNYYTAVEIDSILGDIASILDEINGEEV